MRDRVVRCLFEARGWLRLAGWSRTFTDRRLCAAIVDRFTYRGTIIETGTTSWCLHHARKAK